MAPRAALVAGSCPACSLDAGEPRALESREGLGGRPAQGRIPVAHGEQRPEHQPEQAPVRSGEFDVGEADRDGRIGLLAAARNAAASS